MRKLLPIISTNVVEIPPVSPSTLASISLAPSLSPASSPSTVFQRQPILFFPTVPIAVDAFDLATLWLISGVVFFSLLSFSIIFNLCQRSRRWRHLQHFNSSWTIRLLLVSFASLWAVTEVLRLTIFRRRHLFPFLPALTLDQQANFCKVNQVLSLGFFEPGLLVTFLFLVNASIRKRCPRRMWALGSVFLACFPVLTLQTLFIFFSPLKSMLPNFMHESSLRYTDIYGNIIMLCKYPMISTLVFGAFAGAYLLEFSVSSWDVLALVINRNIRARIRTLALTVMIALPFQVLCLALSALWTPNKPAYSCAVLVMFLCVALLVVIGEVILVIRPITEALAAGGNSHPFDPLREITIVGS